MILEAFSNVLRAEKARHAQSAIEILHYWLLAMLSEAQPRDMVQKVLHTELALLHQHGQMVFEPQSASGQVLLDSLYQYCDSYEQWQFSRWLHELKPHQFSDSPR